MATTSTTTTTVQGMPRGAEGWNVSAETVAAIGVAAEAELGGLAAACRASSDAFGLLAATNGRLAGESAVVSVIALAGTDGEARKAANEVRGRLRDAWTRVWADRELYAVLKAAAGAAAGGGEPGRGAHEGDGGDGGAGSERRVYEQRVLAAMEACGAGLDDDAAERVRVLEEALSAAVGAFEDNLNGDTTEVVLASDEVDGLPESVLDGLDAGEDAGSVRVPLKRPTLLPALKHAKRGSVRRKLAAAAGTQCLEANGPLFEEMVRVRHALAGELGYASHAEQKTAADLPGSPAPVFALLEQVMEAGEGAFEAELAELAAIKGELVASGEMVVDDGSASDEVVGWDVAMLSEAYKKRKYNVDDEAAKPYFELWSVVASVFGLYEEMFGLVFVEAGGGESVWHADVVRYEVSDRATGRALGVLYLDLFPRPHKYGHQMVVPLFPSYVDGDGVRHLPSAVIMGNNSKPTATRPALLRFAEVHTLLHEIGHLVHALVTQVEHPLFSWAWSVVPWRGGVEMSFLETPSQTFERMVYDPAIVRQLGKHHETGEAIPDDLVAVLVKTQHVAPGFRYRRQIALSLFDLIVHSSPGPPFTYAPLAIDAPSVPALYAALAAALGLPPPIDGTNFAASFYHATTYSAAYYGYLWSEVGAADAYNMLRDGRADAGMRYRECVLGAGAVRTGDDMMRAFLGRPVDVAAFLTEVGFA